MIELAEILQRCRAGDELAWEHLVRAWQGRVCAIAYGYVGSVEEARDVAQNVFIQVYRRLGEIPDAERFPAWMVRVARNAALDRTRRIRARPPAEDLPATEVRGLAVQTPDPEASWVLEERRRLLHRAIASLGGLSREMILLREIQGLALEEIADLLAVPLGTVKSRCNRARLELAQAVLAQQAGAGAAPH